MIRPEEIKKEFPIFNAPENDGLVYLDNAATTQKPHVVINNVLDFYKKNNANIHRGLYPLAQRADYQFEFARDYLLKYFNAERTHEVIFTSGTTAAINLVAQGFLAHRIEEKNEVLISVMEHHANFIPWQQVCKNNDSTTIVVDTLGEVRSILDKLRPQTKMVALTQLSNTLGNELDISKVLEKCQLNNIPLLVDAAQSASCIHIDLSKDEIDFLTFSAHKIFGPTGVGVLFIHKKWANDIFPITFGGDMIKSVGKEKTIFSGFPGFLETGTPNIAGVVGLTAALKFISEIGKNNIHRYLSDLRAYAKTELEKMEDIHVIGYRSEGCGIISFVMDGVHAHDIASILGEENIAVRAGHHCTQPLHHYLKVEASVRASFSIYNSEEDVHRLISGLNKVRQIFRR